MPQILGCCDGVIGESVSGWVANIAHPEMLEGVLCWGTGQARLPFSAFFGRADVCTALSLRGRFGFAIPVTALRPLGPVIRITTIHGEDLTGGAAITLPPPSATPPPSGGPAWVMLHIPKTAGTSLRMALTDKFHPGEVLFVYNDGFNGISRHELSTLPFAQRAAARLVVGHTEFGIGRHLPRRVHYITVLREPLARLRSNYYHHLGARTLFQQDGKRLAPSVAMQGGLVEEFDNIMTRILSGATLDSIPIGTVSEADVDQAIDNIRTRFRFVALVEHLDEHYRTLSAIMDMQAAKLTRSKTRTLDEPAAADAQVDWAQASERNRFDRLLYQRVVAEGLCGIDLACDGR